MKTCPSCRRMYSDITSVCPKCGTSLPTAAPTPQYQAPQPPAPAPKSIPVQQPAQTPTPVQKPAQAPAHTPVQQPVVNKSKGADRFVGILIKIGIAIAVYAFFRLFGYEVFVW